MISPLTLDVLIDEHHSCDLQLDVIPTLLVHRNYSLNQHLPTTLAIRCLSEKLVHLKLFIEPAN